MQSNDLKNGQSGALATANEVAPERAIVPSGGALARVDGSGLDGPFEQKRAMLERRIRLAKTRLVADVRRAEALMQHATGVAKTAVSRVLVRAAVTAVSVVALGLLTAGVRLALRRRRHQLRVTWR